MSDFWSIFITVGTLGSIVFYVYVLMVNRKTTKQPGELTGHSYDGIEELDNPLPAWWFWLFMLTVIYAIGYLIYYPGLGNYEGTGGWTSHGELNQAMAENDAKFAPLFAKFKAVPVETLYQDKEAMKIGQRLYATNCSVCHGSTAKGAVGFPNLTDQVWLWGGQGSDIETTIKFGRTATMPAHGAMYNAEQISDLTTYLLAFDDSKQDVQAIVRGQTTYSQMCFACHGAEAKGNPMMGAPDLTNGVWLYGADRQTLEASIAKGRGGVMPAFNDRLGEDKVHILAAYIYGLSQPKNSK